MNDKIMIYRKENLFEDAAKLVVKYDSGSTSLLQRRLVIGYDRAGRIMSQLEVAGIVGEFYKSKPRKVLASESDLEEIFKRIVSY
jgi:S-DNA-T family DNA segregation ATPase FtsK/SpoIIIE